MLETHRATDEELLQEVVDELKDALEEDLVRIRSKESLEDEDFEFKYPKFKKAVDEKALLFKQKTHGYRQICCLPSFALGLVMASRIQSHFTHAPWFKIVALGNMIDVHGTVTKPPSPPTVCSFHPQPFQFISEFMVQSVEYLERIANLEQPPLNYSALKEKREQIEKVEPELVTDSMRASLKEMGVAFRKPGDLSCWTPEILNEIDKAFVKIYVQDDQPIPCLFFPDSAMNLNLYDKYCQEVVKVLQHSTATGPPYAREYFIYYSMWQIQGFKFPMPLGTASVVDILNKMLLKVRRGFSEVSPEHPMNPVPSRCIAFSSASALTTCM
jgi:hypothetical protein